MILFYVRLLIRKINERKRAGRPFTILVIAAGARPKDGEIVVSKIVKDSPDPVRLGGSGNKLASQCLQKA